MKQRRESGQAIVETAIVMPFFVFMLLGILQLSLMHQARLMTKYAAFKATRAGSIGNAKTDRMEKAALAVLLPFISGFPNGQLMLSKKTTSGSEFAQAWMLTQFNLQENGIKHVEITICGPTKELLRKTGNGGDQVSFDDPKTGTSESEDWERFERTRLSVQVTFNYRMIIPYANMMLWHIAFAQENADVLWLSRTGSDTYTAASGQLDSDKSSKRLAMLAMMGIYVLPIRADWAMRMQSDLFPEQSAYALPESNECAIRFPRKGGGGSGGGATVDVDQED